MQEWHDKVGNDCIGYGQLSFPALCNNLHIGKVWFCGSVRTLMP